MSAFAWRSRIFALMLGALLLAVNSSQAANNTDAANQEAEEAVREALQREVYGLDADREELLSAALEAAPDNPAAHWHLGYVRSETGKWIKADDRSDKKRQTLLHVYEKLRSTHEDTVTGQLALADWCAKQGLSEQERVHLLRVCDFAPDHPSARQRLGFARVGREWVSRTELETAQARQAASQKAFAHWTPIVTRLASQLAAMDVEKQQAAAAQIKQIRDPGALPALQAILATRGEKEELLVVDVTAAMSDPAAVVALARHAVFSPNLFVRQQAATKLQACDQDIYVPLLISSMYTPVVSRIAAVSLPRGRIGYRHEFLREGAERQELLVLDTEYRRVGGGNNHLAALNLAVTDARQTARRMELAAEAQNRATAALNDRIGWVLSTATGVELPAVPDDWWTWWNDQNEVFVEGSKAIATQQLTRRVTIVDAAPSSGGAPVSGGSGTSGGGFRHDCLAAGTPVWTERGQVAIEKIRAGDLVLSRDVESGELAFKPVLRTTIRPAGPLVKIEAGKEVFETSGGHLFWVSGEGWVKSRKLQTGMVLHTANGPARVTAVSEGQTAETYNLVVADFNTYFVGDQQLLSHDNTVRRTTNVIVPGLK